MADSVITLKDQKFRKVKGVWVDQKKTPAPKDLIGLLDKLSTAEAAAAGPEAAKEDKPALPVLPIAAKDFSTAKLESSINRLAKIVENLAKSIEKGTKSSTGANAKDAPSAQRIYEPGKIPTLREAMKLNRQEFFKGTTNKYGEVEQRGLLRDLGSILPSKANKYRAQDRQRAAIGSELREYEGTLQSNPNLSKKQINEKIAEKRKELENPKAVPAKPEPVAQRITKDTAKQVAQMKVANPELTSSKALEQIRSKPAMPEAISAGEKERGKTLVQGKSEFASPDVDKNITSVKITDIDESVLKKLSNIFGKKADKESPDYKEEEKENKPESGGGGGGGFFDKIRKRLFGGNKRLPAVGPTSEIVKDAANKSRYAAGAVDASGKKIGGQFIKAAAEGAENVAEAAAKKPSVLSKLFGGGTAAAEGVEQAAKKPNVLSKLFGGASRVGGKGGQFIKAAAEGAENVAEQAAKKPNVLSKLFSGASRVGGRGLLSGAGRLAGRAALPVAVGMEALGYATGEKAVTARNLTGSAGGLAGAAGGAAAGAAIGSVVPVVGTAIGGIAGGIAGYYGGGKLANVAYDKIFGKRSKPKPTTAAETKTLIANEPFIPGQPMSKMQQAATKMSMDMGNTPSAEIMKSYEMTKPTGVTPQTQALTSTTKQVEAAKQQRPAAGPTVINNNVSSPTNVSSSQGVIGGPTVADRGSLNLASF